MGVEGEWTVHIRGNDVKKMMELYDNILSYNEAERKAFRWSDKPEERLASGVPCCFYESLSHKFEGTCNYVITVPKIYDRSYRKFLDFFEHMAGTFNEHGYDDYGRYEHPFTGHIDTAKKYDCYIEIWNWDEQCVDLSDEPENEGGIDFQHTVIAPDGSEKREHGEELRSKYGDRLI